MSKMLSNKIKVPLDMIRESFDSLDREIANIKHSLTPPVIKKINSLTHLINSSICVANLILKDYADLISIRNDDFDVTPRQIDIL